MSRKLAGIDRLIGTLVALVLVAAGLLLVDWQLGLVLTTLPGSVAVPGLVRATDAGWWPFATAAVAVLLLLLALRWLFAHAPKVGSPDAQLSSSSGEGRIHLDTGSVARATAADITSPQVLPEARGRVRSRGGRPWLHLDTHCAPGADVAELRERAEHVSRDLVRAFPSGDVPLRILVDAPRTRVRDRGRRAQARVE